MEDTVHESLFYRSFYLYIVLCSAIGENDWLCAELETYDTIVNMKAIQGKNAIF